MPRIAILTDTPQEGERYETVYGESAAVRPVELVGRDVLVCAPETADPRATVHALKDQGVTHLWL
jgi:hypothetical protein